jgi:hypothetical protein
MGIVISHGGANFDNFGNDMAAIIFKARDQQREKDRYETLRQKVEQDMDLNAAEEKRRASEYGVLQQQRATVPGMIGGMFDRPAQPNQPDSGMVGPSDPNSEDAQFQASIRANTERAGKMAAEIAKADPAKGMEYAKRFLDEEQANLHRLVADRGITKMTKDIGEGLTTPGTYTVTDPNSTEADPTYQEAMKGVLQALQTAQGPDVSAEDKVKVLDYANKTRMAIRRDITERNTKNAAVAAARHTIETRAAEAGNRLTTDQKARIGSLGANVGFEEGMIPPNKVDAEVERILRGTVQVPNPFSFGGGDMLEMTPESAVALQKTLAQISLIQEQQRATGSLGRQRDAAAGLSDARAEGKLQLPRGQSGGPNAILDRSRATQIAKTELGDEAKPGDIKARADELMGTKNGAGGPTPEDQLAAEVKAKKITTPEQLKKRAAELGAKLKQ